MKLVPILGSQEIDEAVARLQAGGLVAIPTETVYGLAAAIDQPEAIARIFAVKGRPQDHPLIVHVSNWDMAKPLLKESIHEYVLRLVKNFSPGPITYIVQKSELIDSAITGGQDSVGIRIPSHPLARAIIEKLGVAIAAPSANTFGAVSPTSALHVFQDLQNYLDGDVDAIVDGGECEIGLESTIVDCRFESPRILRHGAITEAMIDAVVKSTSATLEDSARVSGTLDKHYAPRARVHVIEKIEDFPENLGRVGFIGLEVFPTPLSAIRLAMPIDENEFAHELYSALRKADELSLSDIVILAPSDQGIGVAIRDRIARAAH